jgi:hypothetical protein
MVLISTTRIARSSLDFGMPVVRKCGPATQLSTILHRYRSSEKILVRLRGPVDYTEPCVGTAVGDLHERAQSSSNRFRA